MKNVSAFRLLGIIFFSFSLTGCKSTYAPLDTVPNFDISRYTGTWYEIARLPNRFEKNLDCVTANYTILPEGKVEVINKGYLINDHTRSKDIKGKAYMPDVNNSSKIKVSFFGPFYGDYWVLAIDNEYKNVLVGDPSRKYLWILSRADTMEINTYKTLENIALKKGFNTSQLIKVNQQK